MSKKKNCLFLLCTVMVIGLAVLAWPINIKIFPIVFEYSEEQISSDKEINQESSYRQKLFLEGEYLDEFEIWLDSIAPEQSGSIQLLLKNESKQIVFDQAIPLVEMKNGAFNKIAVKKKIVTGRYTIEINAVDCGKDNFHIGLVRNKNRKKRAALNYRCRKSMNAVQTIMYWMLLFELWLVVWKLLGFLTIEKIRQVFSDSMILGQASVIMGAISLFCLSAVLSPAVTWEKSWCTLWPCFVIWVMFIALALRLKVCVARKTMFRAHFAGRKWLPAAILIMVNCIIRIPMLGTLQRWDAGEYYYRLGTACRNYQFNLNSLLDNFRLCSHSTLGFSVVAAIGEFFSPRNSVGVLLVSLVLTMLAIMCLYYLFRDAWLKCSPWLAAGFTLIVSFTPIFLGTFAYINPDYFLAVYLIFLLYSDYKHWNILAFAAAVLVSQCKETGVLVIAGYYGLKIITDFVICKGSIIKRFKTIMSKSAVWIAMAAAAIYELLVFKLGSFTTWQQAGNVKQGSLWSNTGFNCFGFNQDYIIHKLRQFFGVNFAWIISIIVICSTMTVLFRHLRAKSEKRGGGGVLKYSGLFGAMLGFAFFGVLYITACLNRYNILFAVGWGIVGVIAYYNLIGYKQYKLVNISTVSLLACLFLIQAFWNIDILSVKLFTTIPISNTNTILYTDTQGYFGDGLVNNYQYTWLDQALNKLFKKIGYSSGKAIFMPTEEIGGSHFDGNTGAYDIAWDVEKEKRVIASETGKEIPVQVYKEAWLTGGVPFVYFAEEKPDDDIPENMYIPLIKYYHVNEDRVQRSISFQYYFGEKDSVECYGGEIEYYQAVRKDDYAGFNILGVLSEYSTWGELEKKDIDEQFVKAAYKNIKINEELLNAQIYKNSKREIKDFTGDRRTVRKGDIISVNIYVYDGDGAEVSSEIANHNELIDQVLEIGSGQCLPGIEEALVGAEVGSTISVECVMPQGYAPALKYENQRLTFNITINEIQSVVESTEIEKEKVVELRQELKKTQLENTINEMSFQVDFASLGYSEQTLEEKIEDVKDYYKQYMIRHDITKQQFLDEFLKIDETSYEQAIKWIARLALCKEYISERFEDSANDLLL